MCFEGFVRAVTYKTETIGERQGLVEHPVYIVVSNLFTVYHVGWLTLDKPL